MGVFSLPSVYHLIVFYKRELELMRVVGFEIFEESNPYRPWLPLGIVIFPAILCLLKVFNGSVASEPWIPWGHVFLPLFPWNIGGLTPFSEDVPS